MACLPVIPATWGWKPYLIPTIHSLATNDPSCVGELRRCRQPFVDRCAVLCRKCIAGTGEGVLLGAIGAPVLRVGVCPADLSLHHRGIVSGSRATRFAGLAASIEAVEVESMVRNIQGTSCVWCHDVKSVSALVCEVSSARLEMSRRLLDASDAREPPNRVEPGIGFFVPEAPIPSRPL